MSEFAKLHAELFPAQPKPAAPTRSRASLGLDDETLLRRAFAASNGAQIQRLFEGDTSAYDGDDSRADEALACHLTFWFNADVARIDRVFRSSGLMRTKWDERRGARTYGEMTIERAVALVSGGYAQHRATSSVGISGSYDAPKADEAPGVPKSAMVAVYTPACPDSSFISRYVNYASGRTDAPPEAHELMAVSILSALAGQGPRLPLAARIGGQPLNLWVMFLVNSTTGRKTTTISLALDILESMLGTDAIIPWEGSPQGLIQRLQERDGQVAVFVRDEYSGLMSQMNRGGHMAGLPQLLIRAYDGGVIENIRTRKKNAEGEWQKDADRVEHPLLVTMSASVRDNFIQRATIDNVLDGFLARFIFWSGSAEPKPMRLETVAMSSARNALVQQAHVFFTKCKELEQLSLSEELLDMAWALETEWMAVAQNSARPDAAGPALKRLSESVLKVAALVAVDLYEGGGVPSVNAEHFRYARTMGNRWLPSTLKLVEDLGATSFMRDTETVLTSIQRQPGIALSALMRKHRNLRKRDFDEILDALEVREQIVREQTAAERGRPSTTLRPSEGQG